MNDDEEGRRVRRMITWKQVCKLVPMSRSTLLSMEARGAFPRGVMITGNRKVWFEDEILEWQASRPPGRAGKLT